MRVKGVSAEQLAVVVARNDHSNISLSKREGTQCT